LGLFQGTEFNSGVSRGGRTSVFAEAGSIRGTTGLTLQLRQRDRDPGASDLPSDPSTRFMGPVDPARAPRLVYPNDGVLLPPNLGGIEIHFRPGSAANTTYELAFANSVTDIRVYMHCPTPLNGGCIYRMALNVWSWIAETNRGSEAVAATLRGTDDTGSA